MKNQLLYQIIKAIFIYRENKWNKIDNFSPRI